MKLIKPTNLKGSVRAPASKSHMQRAIAISALTKGQTILQNISYSDDALAALSVAQNLGSKISQNNDNILIEGGDIQFTDELNCGESGLCARMFSPIAATFNHPIQITGTGSLLKRPQEVIVHSLKKFNAEVDSNNGYLPLTIQGPLKGGNVSLEGSFTSQVLTGLLIALPLIDTNTTVHIENLTSKPYIDMTLNTLRKFGINIENTNYQYFSIKGKNRPTAITLYIDPDWSGIAFLLVAGAIAGDISVNMQDTNTEQADKAILDVLQQSNANIEISMDSVVSKQSRLRGFEFDATQCPDLFPPLVALALNSEGISKIHGVHRLIHKESNRAAVLKNEFNKVGGNIYIQDDTMIIEKSKITSGVIDSHNDHRIAMAAAVTALNSESGIYIKNPYSINKSYPDFYNDLASLGADISE